MTAPRSDLGELPAQLAELRELIREAHGVTKDLRREIRDARRLADDLKRETEQVVHDAAAAEMTRWADHVQHEMNRSAAELNRSLVAARDHIGRALLPKIAQLDLADAGSPGVLMVKFDGNLFDADVPTGEPS
jgi:DNA repair ATPase RecN